MSVSVLNPEYITGFVDGEGSFTFSRSNGRIGLYFAIKLRSGDLDLLTQIQEYFGVGRIYAVNKKGKDMTRGPSAYYYRVTKIAELKRVVEHFDRFPLRGRKAQSYAIWRQMVLMKEQFRRSDQTRLGDLAQLLSLVNR